MNVIDSMLYAMFIMTLYGKIKYKLIIEAGCASVTLIYNHSSINI